MPAARVQYPVMAGIVYLVLKPGSQHWGSDNQVNVGPVSIWDVNGNTEDDKHPGSDHPKCQHSKVTWRKYSEKD